MTENQGTAGFLPFTRTLRPRTASNVKRCTYPISTAETFGCTARVLVIETGAHTSPAASRKSFLLPWTRFVNPRARSKPSLRNVPRFDLESSDFHGVLVNDPPPARAQHPTKIVKPASLVLSMLFSTTCDHGGAAAHAEPAAT